MSRCMTRHAPAEKLCAAGVSTFPSAHPSSSHLAGHDELNIIFVVFDRRVLIETGSKFVRFLFIHLLFIGLLFLRLLHALQVFVQVFLFYGRKFFTFLSGKIVFNHDVGVDAVRLDQNGRRACNISR